MMIQRPVLVRLIHKIAPLDLRPEHLDSEHLLESVVFRPDVPNQPVLAKLFAEYARLPPEERPKTDLEKRQQWCTRLSRIVGEDLTPEFQFLLK